MTLTDRSNGRGAEGRTHDPQPPVELPASLRVREVIAERIGSGGFEVGGRLPSERELAGTLEVARMTVRRALGMLESEGLIYRADRRGYFVSAPRLRYDPTQHVNCMQLIRLQGHEASNEYLGRALISASPSLARRFRCAEETELIVERSIASMNGRRILYEENILLSDAIPGYLERRYESPLTQALEKHHNLSLEMTGFRARPTRLLAEAAERLGVGADSPGLHITRIKEHDGRVVEVDREYWLSDALEIIVGNI